MAAVGQPTESNQGPLPLDIRLIILEFMAERHIRCLASLRLTSRVWYHTCTGPESDFIWRKRSPSKIPLVSRNVTFLDFVDNYRAAEACRCCGSTVPDFQRNPVNAHPYEFQNSSCCKSCYKHHEETLQQGVVEEQSGLALDWDLHSSELPFLHHVQFHVQRLPILSLRYVLFCQNSHIVAAYEEKKARRADEIKQALAGLPALEENACRKALEEGAKRLYLGLKRDILCKELQQQIAPPSRAQLKWLAQLQADQDAVIQHLHQLCATEIWPKAQKAFQWIRFNGRFPREGLRGHYYQSWLAFLVEVPSLKHLQAFLEEVANPSGISHHPGFCTGCEKGIVDLRCAFEFCDKCCPRVSCPVHVHSYRTGNNADEDDGSLSNPYFGASTSL